MNQTISALEVQIQRGDAVELLDSDLSQESAGRGNMTAAGRKRLSELLKKCWAQGKMGRKKKAA